jgi:virginiamycin B lyase
MNRSDLPTRRRFLVLIGLAPLLVACRGESNPTAQPTSVAAVAASSSGPSATTASSAPIAPTPTSVAASLPTAPASPASPAASRAASPVAALPSVAPASPVQTAIPTGATPGASRPPTFALQEYPVRGSAPHDVAPARDGGVWYVAQGSGQLGLLDPASGNVTKLIALGRGSAPHGVIVGPDGAPWITDGGVNAIVRVDPATDAVQTYPLPTGFGSANLNTATFDGRGRLWFTGQNGIYGRLEVATGTMRTFDAPRGRGAYGICTTPGGEVYYVSLAGSHLAKIDLESGKATVIDPPTPNQGARRVWSDSRGRLWISEWNSGQVSVHDPATKSWQAWKLPGQSPQAYAVYVDERDIVWLTDFPNNAIVRFDPATEMFQPFPLPSQQANVRQLLGRPGEVCGAESRVDKLVVVRTT